MGCEMQSIHRSNFHLIAEAQQQLSPERKSHEKDKRAEISLINIGLFYANIWSILDLYTHD